MRLRPKTVFKEVQAVQAAEVESRKILKFIQATLIGILLYIVYYYSVPEFLFSIFHCHKTDQDECPLNK